ncbi:MAG: NAD(P)-dependent oxidoreductase [Armatimonadetes bacterium]|nr:NAD(P)-dependent oxidoreductase [Armatimonadota bacterium]
MPTLPKVAVSGAAGHLGSHVVPLLVKDSFEVLGFDIAPPPSPPSDYRFLTVDLTDPVALREALQGSEIIVHCASIHPWKSYSEAQYLDANIKGTWNLYSAAAELGIDRIVLTSSIVAGGLVNIPVEDWPVEEDRQYSITDLYSFTKHAQEDTARVFADRGQIRTIALRPPAFMPKPELETGFCLTGAFALVSDIASAHAAATRVFAGLHQPDRDLRPFEPVFITNKLPYTREDASLREADGNMRPLVGKYWPKAYDWLVERGYQGAWLPTVFDLERAGHLLGWQPAFNFDQWFAQVTVEN